MKKRTRLLAGAGTAALAVTFLAGCGSADAEGAADCTDLPLTDERVTTILADGGTWKGSGEFTPTAASSARTDGSEMFTEVIYVKGDAPGIEGQVFTFVTSEAGLLVGADSVTREFWTWGDAAKAGSPADTEARAAVDAAGAACLS